MVLTAIKPPSWVWPARVLGVSALMMSVLLPVGYVYRQFVSAMPKEKVISLRELRPTMLVLPTGTFQMGRAANETVDDPVGIHGDEMPQHQVEISRSYGISETEVTQGQYQAVMGTNPSQFRDQKDSAKRPVESGSWLDAVAYCNKLSELEGLPKCYEVEGASVKWPSGLACKGYRLPTEAEWEYAARAEEGTIYSGSNKPEEVAWFDGNSESSTHAVKGKKPNQWGLYDLSGNVYEWVWDQYGTYPTGAQKDPTGPLLGFSLRVYRGGSWVDDARYVRVAIRLRDAPGVRNRHVGFRLARSYP